MSKVQSPEPNVSSRPNPDRGKADFGLSTLDFGLSLEPTVEEFAVLSSFERCTVRFVRRMNRGAWKRFWTWCQKVFGAGWIHFATYNLMQVYGLQNVAAVSRDQAGPRIGSGALKMICE